MAKYIQTVRAVWIAAAIAGLAGCGESEQAKPTVKPPPASPAQLTVGGTVSGLAGSGLILQLNGANDLAVKADGKFNFAKALVKGSAYSVTVKAAPAAPLKQTCTVGQGNGSVANASINNVAVTCTTNSYAVGGTVTGLSGKGSGKVLVLQLNGANDLTISKNGKFIFVGVRLPDGSDYSVAIKATPAKRVCEIKPVSAAFDNDTLNIVAINCTKKGRHR